MAYAAMTRDGENILGVLASDAGASITLAAQDGKRHAILRAELAQLQNTGRSLMPDGMEKELSHQDAADVIAHLRTAPAASR
jgi:putative heme-binding domain-containing protein